MSGSGRKRSSRWDFKEDSQNPRDARGNDYPGKSGTCFRDKEPEPGQLHPEANNGRNGGWRSSMDDDEQLKPKCENKQYPGEPWPRFSRDGDGMIGNYGTRKSSVLEEFSQQNLHHPVEDQKRIHGSRSRSMSRSRSRSRSRSPFCSVRRESGFCDRHKNRPWVSPQLGKEFDGRYRRVGEHQSVHYGDQGHEHGWEAKNRRARDSKYYPSDDSRVQPTRGGRSAEFGIDFPEDNSRRVTSGRHLHDGTSDGFVRSHRNEFMRERDSLRRDGNTVFVNNCEGELHKKPDILCKFYAAGYCRNGNSCRFSHHSASRRSPDRKPHNDKFRLDNNRSESYKWNVERSETRKPGGNETTRVNAVTSEPKANGNWVDDMEMSPDWNYGVQGLNNSKKDENGHVSQSSQILGLKDSSVPAYEHGDVKEGLGRGSTRISQNLVTKNCNLQQDQNHRGTNVSPHNGNILADKPWSSNHDPSNPVNVAPVQTLNQNGQSQGALPYKSLAPLTGSHVLSSTDLSGGLGLGNSEIAKGYQENHLIGKPVLGDLEPSKVSQANFTTQNTVTTEQLSQISNISASLAQLFGNGQQLPQLYSTLKPQNAMQVPLHTSSEGYVKSESSAVIQPNQADVSQTHNDPISNCIPPRRHEMGAVSEGIPSVTAALTNMTDAQQRRLPVNSVSSDLLVTVSETGPADRSHEPAGNPKASEENNDKKSDESKKGQDEKKATGMTEDAEKAEADDKVDENKKGKDPKGMRAFKFALVETVKGLLKPAWKEGRMGRDAYKNIVKKVVDKVTSTMQGGNIPQTQEKIDNYLASATPKLTKLVQAYVNKYQKS